MLVEIIEVEPQLRAVAVEIDKPESLEIACQDIARLVPFSEPVEIVGDLLLGSIKVAACALLFDNQRAGPEQVDKTAPFRFQ